MITSAMYDESTSVSDIKAMRAEFAELIPLLKPVAYRLRMAGLSNHDDDAEKAEAMLLDGVEGKMREILE